MGLDGDFLAGKRFSQPQRRLVLADIARIEPRGDHGVDAGLLQTRSYLDGDDAALSHKDLACSDRMRGDRIDGIFHRDRAELHGLRLRSRRRVTMISARM